MSSKRLWTADQAEKAAAGRRAAKQAREAVAAAVVEIVPTPAMQFRVIGYSYSSTGVMQPVNYGTWGTLEEATSYLNDVAADMGKVMPSGSTLRSVSIAVVEY